VHPGLSAALDDCAAVDEALERAFSPRGWTQAFLGIDPWARPETVPQQLEAPRYPAMARYLALRGPAGAWMMRLSASLQVNLDLGPGAAGPERALLGFLLSPVLTAIFSTSPELPGQPRRHSRRARVWQTLDPSRSGFPRRLVEDPGEPLPRAYARAALEADVLLLKEEQGGAIAGTPGRRFADWIAAPDPRLGWPTEEDLRYHLSTLFFEVRCRGFLELRAVDALPPPWRPAAAGLIAGLLLDDRARGLALERLTPTLRELPERWWLAADQGLSLPGLREEASFLFETARCGLARLGVPFVRREHVESLERFHEQYTARGLAPADCLREWLTDDPALALEWARGGQVSRPDQRPLAEALD
jgi:glutamate--cysteine ligase